MRRVVSGFMVFLLFDGAALRFVIAAQRRRLVAPLVEERLFAGKRVKIGAADTDPVDSHKGLCGCGQGLMSVGGGEMAVFFENDLDREER